MARIVKTSRVQATRKAVPSVKIIDVVSPTVVVKDSGSKNHLVITGSKTRAAGIQSKSGGKAAKSGGIKTIDFMPHSTVVGDLTAHHNRSRGWASLDPSARTSPVVKAIMRRTRNAALKSDYQVIAQDLHRAMIEVIGDAAKASPDRE